MLSACSGGSSSPDRIPTTDSVEDGVSGPVDSTTEKPEFELVEATTASVHAALAGETMLADGSTLTCEKLVTMYQQRILAFNDNPQSNGGLPIRGVLNLSTTAIDQAKELDRLYALDNGIGERYIHCMPVLLKDNYDTFDQPSTSGSFAMLGHTAGVDADSVAGLRAAGAVILGKANQDEFAYFTLGFSARGIQVTNPYNTAESPAGSSSGTGASMAANFALGGTGSDTCQSIRHPSSVNGLVGIRPSIGVISAHGIYPLAHQRDTGGPMVRTVTDAALMLTAMARVDPRDFRTENYPASERPASYADFLDREAHGVMGKNIGVLRLLGTDDDPDGGGGQQGQLIRAAADKLIEMGANVYDFYLPDYASRGAGSTHYDMNEYWAQFDAEGGTAARACLSDAAATETHGRAAVCIANTATTRGGILESGRVGPRTSGLIALSATSDPDQAPSDEQLQAIADMRAYVTGAMDVLLDENGDAVLDGQGNTIRLDAFLLSPGPDGGTNCALGSTTQMGSIVVPVGFDSSVAGNNDPEGRGVPRGMEIFVRQFDEGTGIGIAYDYEQETLHRAPPFIEPNPAAGEQSVEDFNRAQQEALAAIVQQPPEQCDAECAAAVTEELTGL